MEWNMDMSSCPRGRSIKIPRTVHVDGEDKVREFTQYHVDPVWLASKDGKVHRSYWVPETKYGKARWSGFTPEEEPVAWMPFEVPKHPFED